MVKTFFIILFGPHPHLDQKRTQFQAKTFFLILFWFSLTFGPQTRSNYGEDLFFFFLEGFISPKIFIFFVYSDSNVTQTQMLTIKLSPNRTLIQILT